MVHDLIEGEQAEVDRHHLDDRTHPPHRRADAGADEGGFGERRVAHPLGTELLEQPMAHGVDASVPADVLAHEEHARILAQRPPQRRADRVAVGRGRHDTTLAVDVAREVAHGLPRGCLGGGHSLGDLGVGGSSQGVELRAG